MGKCYGYVRVVLLPDLIFEIFHLEHQFVDDVNHRCVHTFVTLCVHDLFCCGHNRACIRVREREGELEGMWEGITG